MGTEKRQILIVDDVELNRAILAELFQDSYEVLEAENGCQALELLEAHHDAILIVLLDIIMPVMDGFEMLQNMALRTWKEEIPVVLNHLRKLRTRRFGHHQQAVQSEYRQATRRQHHRTLPAQAPS